MPGRKRIPTALKVVQGTAQPCRMNPGEPEGASPVGEPPAEFDPQQVRCWAEVIDNCHPGVLSLADTHAVEIAAVLLAEFRSNYIAFPSVKLGKLTTILGQLGMTPADRSRVTAKPDGPDDDDPAARFRGR